MYFYRFVFFSLLLCLVFPLTLFADQLGEANTAMTNEDYKKAYELLLPLAEDDNPEAQTRLGALYINGQGVEKDFNKGLGLVMKAATKGYEPARIMAYKLCMDLGNQGDAAAMYNVGYMCLKGWVGEQDTDVCLKWLETAGKMGHDKSSKILARIYKDGMFGITPDKEKSAYWSNLANAFDSGIDGKWEGSVPGMGGRPMKLSYDFKTDGDILEGTTTVEPGDRKVDIKDGKIEGNNVSFRVESKLQGMKITSKYTGVFLGDTLRLTYVTNMGRGDLPPATVDLKRAE